MISGNENILEIRDLSIDYLTKRGRLKALRNASLSVRKNRIVGVVGESGCGKSTLIFAIMNLLAENAEINHGTIDFEGQDLLILSKNEMRKLRGGRISMVFQDPMTSLNPVFSIGEQMVDIQHREKLSKKEKQHRAAQMLSKVGIPDAEKRLKNFPDQFSGGMRQRISIAMALMAEPSLLIADEPTTALDATLEIQIVNRLRKLQADFKCSILFVSHHLGLIADICDDVVVMYTGEVVEEGSVRDIFHRAGHPYTKALLECDPARISDEVRDLPTIPGDIPDLANLPEGCIFRNRCSKASEICQKEAPQRREIESGHFVSCHNHHQETNNG